MKTKCEYSGTLFIISRKYFSVFRGPHLPLDTPFWTRCFPLVMQSRKAGFPFAARAWMRENFQSESFSIRTSEGRAPASELVLQRGSLPSEIATAGLFD